MRLNTIKETRENDQRETGGNIRMKLIGNREVIRKKIGFMCFTVLMFKPCLTAHALWSCLFMEN